MLLTNAEIWRMDAPDINSGYVRISDGVIRDVGVMSCCPNPENGEETVDLNGRKLLPGFIDSHTHMGLCETGLGVEGDDVNEDTEPATPHLRAIDGINPLDPVFKEACSSGITCAVISPGSSNPVGGQVCAVRTHGRWIDRMSVAQPLAIKFALGENPKMTFGSRTQMPVTRMGTVAVIREQLHKAKRYLSDCERAAEDPDLEPPEYDIRAEALSELLKGNIKAHFHAHRSCDILSAVRIAKEFSLDYTIVHATEGHLIADILAQEESPVICGPLLTTRTKPELMNLTLNNCATLMEAGVCTSISTDHPEMPADGLLMSASMAKSAGLNAHQAISAITWMAAKVVGLDHRFGSITPGKEADLLVFDGDLFEIGKKPERVMISGKWVSGGG